MSSISRSQLFGAFMLFALLSQVIAHSYVTSPISRSFQAQSESGCRGPACLGPCDIPLASATRAPISATRGSSITVEWPRNNHAGGFIRFAWAPTAQSDDASVFDSNVQQINCHEVGGCGPSDPSDPNGGDNGPADGSSMACTTTLTVPETLADGKWTLQWAWFGGAFSLGDYYSCVDYSISGGPTGSFTPAFVGGDFTYPGQQKCKFFNTNALHMCVDEPCNNPIFTLSQEQSGAPAAGQIGTGLESSSTSTSTSTTGSKTSTSTSTTGSKIATSTSTTGSKTATSTTGSKAATSTSTSTSTTGSKATSTTGKKASSTSTSTTGKASTSTSTSTTGKSSTSPSSSGSNCAAVSTLSSSVGSLSIVSSWTGNIQFVLNLDVTESVLSNWVVEVIWPATGAVSVTGVFNAGSLQCQTVSTSGSSVFFKPAANWANNLVAGSSAPIEFIASTNLDASTIVNNAQVLVYKQ